MSATSVSLNLKHLCHWCLTEKDVNKVCNRCNSTFYCSIECQENDWKSTHKIFCVKAENKQYVKSRNQKCLEIITSYPNAVFKYLFSIHSFSRKGFLAVYSKKYDPYFVPIDEKKRMEDKVCSPLCEKKFIEIVVNLELAKTDNSSRGFRAIPIVDLKNREKRVYLLGSEAVKNLSLSVHSLPDGVVKKILSEFIKNKIASWTPDQCVAYAKLLPDEKSPHHQQDG